MLYSVDRIEGEFVHLQGEDHQKITLKCGELLFAVNEGDVLSLENGVWRLDPDETNRRRAKVRSLLNSLLEE